MIACLNEPPSGYRPNSAVGPSEIVVELMELRRRMVRDLERFLSLGLHHPQGWPRRRNSGRAEKNANPQDGSSDGQVKP